MKIAAIPDDALVQHKGRLTGSGEEDGQKWVMSFKKSFGKRFPEFQYHVSKVSKSIAPSYGAAEKSKPQELAVKYGISARMLLAWVSVLSTRVATAAFLTA